MKNLYTRLGKAMLIFSGLLFSMGSYAQLNGNYTINPLGSASSTNYKDWASAAGDLISGSRTDGGTAQGPGVNSAVTFTVYDTTYGSTQVRFTSITGASSSNTITFKSAGGDSTKCKLTYASSATNSSADFVVGFDGADYITFQRIGLERTGAQTYSTVVEITNDADYIALDGCWLKGRKIPSSSSLGFQYGVGSCIYYVGNGDYTQVKNCALIYGYNGIYSTIGNTGVKITGNLIDTSGSAGVYMTSQTNLEIVGNTFNMGDFGPNQGHYTSYGMRIEISPNMLISKNKVYMMATNGQVVRAIVLANTTSTATAPTRVSNNWIVNGGGTGDCTGLAIYACYYVEFYYNNVLITNSLANGAGYYHYPQYTNSNIKLVNNNFVNKGAGYAYNVPGTNTADLDTVDYNNLYSSGTYLANWGGTDYATFSGLKSASSKDVNSINADPGYVNNRDLHVSNISLNGKAMVYSKVIEDIDNEFRSPTTPDIGADEFFPVTNDAGISNVDSPLVFCSGVKNVKVTFQNYGIDTVKSVEINWMINGSAQTPVSWTGTVAPGNSSASVGLGSFTFAANTPYIFKVWTKNPNNTADGKNNNDTITITRYAGMTGTYTIGDTGAIYKSFNDAINDMTSRGICGALTFNVYPGTYTEQITLVQLPGMGASNPVVFQNINSDSTTIKISLPSTTATGNNNAAIQLRGADYVTFRGMSVERTGFNAIGHVIHVLNGSNNNKFISCRMLGLVVSSVNASAYNIWSDQSIDNNNVFLNNYIRHGTNSMLYLGSTAGHESGTVIEGNTFDSAYNSAVQIGYNDELIVKGNTFRNIRITLSSNYDLQLNDCDSATQVIGNIFTDPNTNIGIHEIYCDASAGRPSFLANNALAKNYGTGILLDGVLHQNIVFNTMYFTNTASTNVGITTTSTTSSNIVMKNNNIVMEGGSVFNITNASYITASDYNNLNTKTTPYAIWGSNSYNNLVALQAGTSKDANSVWLDPYFFSGTDLHIKNPMMKALGTPVSGITTDMDGETRNSTAPDIGADEFEFAPNDAGISAIITPKNGACAGLYGVQVVLRNWGKDTLKTVTVDWSVGGNAQPAYSWNGNLPSQKTDTITIGTYNFLGSTNPVVVVKTSLPNGQADNLGNNDSIRLNRQINPLPAANAGTDGILCLGDSVQLGVPATTGFTYSWLTPSNVQLATTAQMMVSPAVQTTYILEVTKTAGGCQNKDTVVISVSTKPTVNAGPDKAVCPGSSATIGETLQSGFSYTWTSKPAGFTSIQSQPNVTPSQNTMYYVKKTNSTSGCSVEDSVEVTINSLPVAQVLGDSTVCHGSTETYTTVGGAGHQYNWSTSGGLFQSGQGTNTVTINWTSIGQRSIQLVETNTNGCLDTSIRSVTIFATPVPKWGFTGSCNGSPISFFDSSANITSRTWNFGDGQSSTQTNPVHVYTLAGSYYVNLIVDDANGCRDSLIKAVNIFDRPSAGFNIAGIACAGSSVAFSNISAGPTNYFWDFGNNQTSTQQNPVTVYPNAGAFNVLLVVIGSGCNDSISKQVIVHPVPDAGFSTVVHGDTVDFTPNDTSAATYSWDFGGGNTSQLKNPSHKFNVSGKWVTINSSVVSQEGCVGTATDSVFIESVGMDKIYAAAASINISPNPFSRSTNIDLQLARPARLDISLYDARGKKISSLLNGHYSGRVQAGIDADKLGLTLGMYLVFVTIDGQVLSRKIIMTE
jgi:PKD repeat protein